MKTARCSLAICSYFVLIEINILIMDEFVVKTLNASSQEKKRSHLPVNISAKDRARKYPEGIFQVDDGLLFCSSCNIVVDRLRKFVTLKLSHTSGMRKKNAGGKQQTLT